MGIKILIGIVCLIVFIYALVKFRKIWFGGYIDMFEDPIDGRELLSVDNEKFVLSAPEKGLSFSTSFWIFIKDWNYRFMNEKIVFDKGGLKCILTPRSNDLIVEIPIYAERDVQRVVYSNVPLQKWVNISIVLDNRYLDLWLNSELYYSKHLPNLPLIQEKKPLKISPNGGFHGYLSRFYYWDYPITRSTIYRIFNSGPIDTSLYGWFSKKWRTLTGKIKISVDVDLSYGDDKKDKEEEEE